MHVPHCERVAADLRAGQVEVVAEQVDEEPPRLDLERDGPPVDDEPDRDLRGRGHADAGRSGRHPHRGDVLDRVADAVDHRVDLVLGDHERRRDVDRVRAQDARRDAVLQRRRDDLVGRRRVALQDGRARAQPPRSARPTRISPTIGDASSRRTAASSFGSSAATRSTRPSRSMMSRLAIAAAAAPEWPEYV